ncbi:unnamed protein product [Prorocentrum cordatum]|nr:unnamed protein product [Polarella glacialis]
MTGTRSTSSATSTATSSTTGSSTSVTLRRFSHVTVGVGFVFPSSFTRTDVATIAQVALSDELGVAQSLVTIDDISSGRRLTQRRDRRATSTSYHVDCRVEVPGTDTGAIEAALKSLVNDTTSFVLSVQDAMQDAGVDGTFQVEYVGAPVVELWMDTTATFTSTSATSTASDSSTSTISTATESSSMSSSTTETITTVQKVCNADSVPYMVDVADSSSCVGIPSGTSCSPVCISGYELIAPINCTDPSGPSDTFGEFAFNPLVCAAAADVELLGSAEVLLVETALLESTIGSGLSADWATGGGERAAIISAFSTVFGLNARQVYIVTIKDLNSDSESGIPSRRLTTQQGLWMKIMIQLYDANDATGLTAMLQLYGGSSFTDELTSALGAAGISIPPGLASAALHVGTPELSTATVPVARWVAQTPWSSCSADCGEGQRTRAVECLTGITDLCNANAPPYYTVETYMPQTEACEQYTSCPYDPFCPSGRNEETGEGCEAQASIVVASIVVSFLIVACVVLRFVRRRLAKRAPTTEEHSRTGTERRWDEEEGFTRGPDDGDINIEWTREDGFAVTKARRGPRHSPRESFQGINWAREDRTTDDRARDIRTRAASPPPPRRSAARVTSAARAASPPTSAARGWMPTLHCEWQPRSPRDSFLWVLDSSSFQRSTTSQEASETAPRPPKRPPRVPKDGPMRPQAALLETEVKRSSRSQGLDFGVGPRRA